MAKRNLGPFILERKVGVGGMGIVYLATYEKTGRKVAVKVLSPAMSDTPQVLKRFEREMKILKKLKAPNIIQYFGGGKQRGQHFYAMEFIDGGSLDEVIKERAPLDWEYVVDCGIQICRGLEKAHELGIIHRDLKPANLFLSKKSGELKLGDFGIARDTTATALTAAGRTVGTYAYMAPEQIIGKPPVSRKTDLYSLGCVLFEMLTGKTPFEADTPAAMLMLHLDVDAPRVRTLNMNCPVWLENLIIRLLEKDPGDRPFDAQATRRALEDVQQKMETQMSVSTQAYTGGATSDSIKTGKPELEKILKKKKKRKKKKVEQQPFYERVWFLSVCLVALVGVLVWAMWPASAEEMYKAAMERLETDDKTELFYAKEDLQELIDTHPDHPLSQNAAEVLERLELDDAMRKAEKAARTGEPSLNQAKNLFVQGLKYALFGDRITALRKYQSLVELFEINQDIKEKKFNTKSYQTYLKLARQQIAEIEDDIKNGRMETDLLILITQNMREADRLMGQSKQLEADLKWNSLLELYRDNKEFSDQMAYCQKRKNREETIPWDYSILDKLNEEEETPPTETSEQ